MHNITTPTHILTHKLCIEWIRYCGLSVFGYCWLTKTFYLCEKFPTCKTYGKYKVGIIRLFLFDNKKYMFIDTLFYYHLSSIYLWLTHISDFRMFNFVYDKIFIAIVLIVSEKVNDKCIFSFSKSWSRTKKCSEMLWGLKTFKTYLSSTLYTTWLCK